MHVVVIGAGKIGKFLISSLREEGHDVVVVDIDEQRVDRIVEFAATEHIMMCLGRRTFKTPTLL